MERSVIANDGAIGDHISSAGERSVIAIGEDDP